MPKTAKKTSSTANKAKAKATAPKKGGGGDVFVVHSHSHNDCYKRAETQSKVVSVYSTLRPAQILCIEQNLTMLIEYGTEITEDYCPLLVSLMKKKSKPKKASSAKKGKASSSTKKRKHEDSGEEGSDEEDHAGSDDERSKEGYEKDEYMVVVEALGDKDVTNVYNELQECIQNREAEFTMQASGTVHFVTKMRVINDTA
jgi:hypothetical protein